MCDYFVKHFLTATCHTCRAKVKVELTATVKKKNRRIVESGSKTSHSVLSFPFLPRRQWQPLFYLFGFFPVCSMPTLQSAQLYWPRPSNFQKQHLSFNYVQLYYYCRSHFILVLVLLVPVHRKLFLPSESSKVGS